MTDRQILTQQIIQDEGIELSAYQDSEGYWSIGVGRLIDKRRGGGITSQEAMMLLDHDLDLAITDLATFAWFPPLDVVRQRAVTNLRFNLGAGGFRTFQRFIHAMAVADYATAAQELLNSQWATQVGARAKEVADRIATGTE